MSTSLILLGTGAVSGVPSFYCGCEACREAAANPRWQRTRCSALVQGKENTLIDTSPDIRTQLLREDLSELSQILLTHWHFDHLGGLGNLEFFVRLTRNNPIKIFTSKETWQELEKSYWFMVDCLSHEVVTSGQSYQFTDFTVTTLDVTHETGTLGFLIENQRRVAYLPDTGPLPLEAQKQIQGVDVLILGAPFWKENWLPDTHLTVDEAIQQGQAVGAGEIILTHLSMHYSEPITAEELDDYLKQFGNVRLGYDGLRLLI